MTWMRWILILYPSEGIIDYYKNSLINYKTKANDFYEKNIKNLTNATWKNQELKNKIIYNLNKEHFVLT
jgi:hypothetical protein